MAELGFDINPSGLKQGANGLQNVTDKAKSLADQARTELLRHSLRAIFDNNMRTLRARVVANGERVGRGGGCG